MKFIVEENDAFLPFFSFFFFVENLIRHWLALTILSVTVLMMKFNFLWGKKGKILISTYKNMLRLVTAFWMMKFFF